MIIAMRCWLTLPVVLALLPAWAGAQQSREANAPVLRGALPAHLEEFRTQGLPPIGRRVEFVSLETFPPTLKGFDVDPAFHLDVTPGTRLPMREARTAMRKLALADARVQSAVGSRFALLGSGWLEAEKKAGVDAPSDRYRLTFYNYARNVPVYVVVADGKVIEVKPGKRGVQPGESHEEVEAASNLVQTDNRYGASTRGLVPRGIQMPSRDDHRLLYVTFHADRRSPALFESRIDMTAGKIVSARSLKP
jgi:hypothetical protein